MGFRKITIVTGLLALTLAGCQTEQQQRAGTGAIIGGGVGALAGQAIGGNTESTLIGAGAGALLGAVVGSSTAPQNNNQYCRYQRRDGTIYTAPCP